VGEDDEMKLPAIREVGALTEYTANPGTELMGFLVFLRTELTTAIEILREETEEMLAEGDAFQRIQVINRLRLRKNRLEAHLAKELREVMDLTRSLVGTSDKSVVETLSKECRGVAEAITGGLRTLMRDFGVD